MPFPSSKHVIPYSVLFLAASVGLGLAACGGGATGATGTGSGGSGPGGTGSGASGSGTTSGDGGLFNNTTATSTTTTTGAGTGSTGATSTGTGGPACDPNPNPMAGAHVWSSNYGDGSNQYGLAVASDAAGNVLLGGSFAGTLTFGADALTAASSSSDMFVAHLGANGTPTWAHRYGTGKDHSVSGIAADAAGAMIFVGHFFGSVDFGGGPFTSVGPNFDDVCMVKLNAQGNHLWSHKYGDISSQVSHGVAVAPNGDIAMVGEFETKLDFGNNVVLSSVGATDAFIAVFDNNTGVVKWAKQFGDVADQSAEAVSFDKNGDVLVTGVTAGAMDFGQGVQALTGTTNAFVVKLSGAGTVTWGKLYGTSKANGEGIGADAAGDILVAGDHEGDIDFGGGALPNPFGPNVFAVKLDPTGKQIWAKSFGDDNSQHTKGAAVDPKGNLLLSGTFSGTVDFGKGKITSGGGIDAFVAKLDPQGCGLWGKGFGDIAFQSFSAVASDPTGDAIVTGSLAGTANLGGNPLTAAGDDVILGKFGP